MFSRKQMIKLLAPLIVEQIMAVLVGMVDVVMVAAVGESAVSGVSLVDSISVLIIQIMGALLPEARYIGPVPGQGAAQGCQKGSRAAGPGDLASLSHHCRDSSCRGTPLAGRYIWKSGTGCNGQRPDLFLDYSPVISLYRTLQCLRSPVPFHGQLKGIHDDFLCHEYD